MLNHSKRFASGVTMLATAFLLTACSFTMRGVITDVVNGNPIEGAQVAVQLGDDREPHSGTSNAEGEYRVKKDDREQTVVYTAEGFEEFSTVINEQKQTNVYLVPTPRETVRRIVEAMQNQDYDTAYQYLHPHFGEMITTEQFRAANSSFADYLALVKNVEIGEPEAVDQYRSESLNKVYTNVIRIPVTLTLELEGESQSNWNFYLQRMEDEDGRDFYHWLMDRTTNSESAS